MVNLLVKLLERWCQVLKSKAIFANLQSGNASNDTTIPNKTVQHRLRTTQQQQQRLTHLDQLSQQQNSTT